VQRFVDETLHGQRFRNETLHRRTAPPAPTTLAAGFW
jgi:hypothetical protein